MKYILSRKEWEELNRLVDTISTKVDCIYVKCMQRPKTGDIMFDRFRDEIYEIIQEAQEELNKLKDNTA